MIGSPGEIVGLRASTTPHDWIRGGHSCVRVLVKWGLSESVRLAGSAQPVRCDDLEGTTEVFHRGPAEASQAAVFTASPVTRGWQLRI